MGLLRKIIEIIGLEVGTLSHVEISTMYFPKSFIRFCDPGHHENGFWISLKYIIFYYIVVMKPKP